MDDEEDDEDYVYEEQPRVKDKTHIKVINKVKMVIPYFQSDGNPSFISTRYLTHIEYILNQ